MKFHHSHSPRWIKVLNDNDLHFIKRFILASGSLKALAQEYGVSYPTIRARLDRLIEKIRAAENQTATDPFQQYVQILAAEGHLSPDTARKLLDAYKQTIREMRQASQKKGESP
ncbi:MAG TPA: DUF2089 family protein [bacterium]|nr:DUF2089 family protein [Candidatus Omnitrophota bacterium]HOJ60083.1 DUF2089 family protein [bacterium]HOL94815.1 DUF2089 family protein [bacterium]HPP02198.1 DUF2089 family protein [bacterium]HXK93143.1 DUF2089 family protein [bacterium]